MVPKAVQDAGYTAVGLGVLALAEIQVRRRAVKAGVESQVNGAKAILGAAAGQAIKVPALALAPLCGAVGLVGRALGHRADQN